MDRLFTEWLPSPTSAGTTQTPRLLSNHFLGDVTVDTWDGINSNLHTYQATWVLHQDSADNLLGFLRAHACKAFLWNMPRDTVDRIWEVTDWSRSSDEDRDIIQVTFEERFMATTPPPALPPPPGLFFRLGNSPLDGPIGLL